MVRMHCLASSASAVCAVEKPTRLRAPVMFPGRLCILRFGFHQKETFYSVRLAECFSAGVSQRTSGKLPVWTVWCECARTFPSPTRSWLTLKLLKANPGAKLGWCVRKWANPTGPGVGGDSKTGFLSRDVSSSSIGGFLAELSGSGSLISNAPQISASPFHMPGPPHVSSWDTPLIWLLLSLLWRVSEFTNRFPHGHKHCRRCK